MKVKLLVSMAGPTAAHNAGDEIYVDDANTNQNQLLQSLIQTLLSIPSLFLLSDNALNFFWVG